MMKRGRCSGYVLGPPHLNRLTALGRVLNANLSRRLWPIELITLAGVLA